MTPLTDRSNAILLGLLITLSVCVGSVGAAAPSDRDASVLADVAGSGTQEDPYEITNATELQAMNEDPDAHYVLTADVDASGTADWNGGDGFEPVAGLDDRERFTGSFDGQGHTITGLTVDRSEADAAGLFAATEDATIERVSLRDVSVTGARRAGSLVGLASNTEISDVNATGSVTARSGGAGGVAGYLVGSETAVTRVHSAVAVTGQVGVGGITSGIEEGGTVKLASASGDVSGEELVGGLAGIVIESDISRSYATGSVDGGTAVGGLVGRSSSSSVESAYASGAVGGDSNVGGLIGINDGTTADLYWSEGAAGQSAAVGNGDGAGTALTTDQLQGPAAASNMDGLDFDRTWAATDATPVLRTEVDAVSLTVPDQVIVERPAAASVSVTLADERTVSASETATYDANASFLSVDAGRIETSGTGGVEVTATLAGATGADTTTVVTPPDVSVEDASLRYDRVGSETAAPVGVTLANDGGADGEFEVLLSINGTVEQRQTVTVPGHDTAEVQFNWSAPEPGTYPVAINGSALGNLTVVEEPETSVASASLSTETLAVGNATTVEATLENSGDAAASHTVELTAGGETIATKEIVVPADGASVSFDYAPEETGEYELSVGGASAGTLTVAEKGSVSVESVDAPDAVGAGESYEVTVTLANSGGLPLTTDVAYSVGGDAVATETVDVPADGTTVTFETSAPEDGGTIEHAVAAGDAEWTGSTTVDAATETPSSDGNDGAASEGSDGDSNDGSTGTTSGDGPGFGAAAALVALAALGLAGRRRAH